MSTKRKGWDEPSGAASPRGWLFVGDEGPSYGFYLDYGPDHYRSPHRYCSKNRPCRECQPGNVFAVVCGKSSRYVESIDQAKAYVEAGGSR